MLLRCRRLISPFAFQGNEEKVRLAAYTRRWRTIIGMESADEELREGVSKFFNYRDADSFTRSDEKGRKSR